MLLFSVLIVLMVPIIWGPFTGFQGDGQVEGVTIAVEHYNHGAFWLKDHDRIWVRPSEQASVSHCYALDSSLYDEARRIARDRQSATFEFSSYRVWSTISWCSDYIVTKIHPVEESP